MPILPYPAHFYQEELTTQVKLLNFKLKKGKINKNAKQECLAFKIGGSSGDRTHDQGIMSPLL